MARRHHIGALSRMAAANAFMGESGWASIALATRMRRTCPTRAAGSSSEATTRRDPSRRNRCRAPLARLRDRKFADSLLEEAVASEPVSGAKFPASWEFTGNFVRLGLR